MVPIIRRDIVVAAIVSGRPMVWKMLRTARSIFERAPMIGPTATRVEFAIVLRMERVGPRACVVVDLGLGGPGKRHRARKSRSHDSRRDDERRMTVQHVPTPLPAVFLIRAG